MPQHLQILREYDLVVPRQDGDKKIYSIAEDQREEIKAVVSAIVQGCEAGK